MSLPQHWEINVEVFRKQYNGWTLDQDKCESWLCNGSYSFNRYYGIQSGRGQQSHFITRDKTGLLTIISKTRVDTNLICLKVYSKNYFIDEINKRSLMSIQDLLKCTYSFKQGQSIYKAKTTMGLEHWDQWEVTGHEPGRQCKGSFLQRRSGLCPLTQNRIRVMSSTFSKSSLLWIIFRGSEGEVWFKSLRKAYKHTQFFFFFLNTPKSF